MFRRERTTTSREAAGDGRRFVLCLLLALGLWRAPMPVRHAHDEVEQAGGALRLAAHLALFHTGDEPLNLCRGNAERDAGLEPAGSAAAPGCWHWHFLPWNDLDGDGERDPGSQDLALSCGVGDSVSIPGSDGGGGRSLLELLELDGLSVVAATPFRGSTELFASGGAGARQQFRSGVDVRRLACVCVC